MESVCYELMVYRLVEEDMKKAQPYKLHLPLHKNNWLVDQAGELLLDCESTRPVAPLRVSQSPFLKQMLEGLAAVRSQTPVERDTLEIARIKTRASRRSCAAPSGSVQRLPARVQSLRGSFPTIQSVKSR